MFRQVAHTLRLLAHAAGHDRESIQIFEDELREAGGRLGALVEAQPEASPAGGGSKFATVEEVAAWVASPEARADLVKKRAATKPYCCRVGCERDAEFEIEDQRQCPDSITHACKACVGDLLQDGVSSVWPLPGADPATSEEVAEYLASLKAKPGSANCGDPAHQGHICGEYETLPQASPEGGRE